MNKKMIKQLEADIENIIKGNYKELISLKKYPKYEHLISLINSLIQSYSSLKTENLKFKSILMEDIENISNVLEEVSKGNLTIQMPQIKLIELSNITYETEEMVKKLRILFGDMLEKIKKVSADISSSATEVSSANTEMKSNIEMTRKQVANVTTSTAELTASIMQVAGNAKKVSEMAEKTKISIEETFKQTEQASSKMIEAQNKVKEAVSKILELKEYAKI